MASSCARLQVPPVGLHGRFNIEQFAARLPRGAQCLGGQRKIVLRISRHGHRLAVGQRDARMIADVARLVKHHLVARIHERAERDVERLGNADGDEDFVLRPVADAEKFFST